MLNYRPGSYKPRELTEREVIETRSQADIMAADFYNSVQELNPFILRVSDEYLNRLLVHEDSQVFIKPLLDYGKGALSNPQLAFKKEVMTLMLLVKQDDFSSVVSLDLCLKVDNINGCVQANLKDIRAGAIPLPKKFLLEKLSSILSAVNNEQSSSAGMLQGLSGSLQEQVMPALKDLCDYQQVIFSSEFMVDSGRMAHITGIEISEGIMELRVDPISVK